MSAVATATLSKTELMRIAQRIYQTHGDGDAAERVLIQAVGDEESLMVFAAATLLNYARLQQNHASIEKARALKRDLSVQDTTPSGLDSVMTGDDLGRGYPVRHSIASFRALVQTNLRIEGKTVNVKTLTREEIVTYAARLKKQGEGCLENAALLSDLARAMKPGERALDAVRRLERESNQQ